MYDNGLLKYYPKYSDEFGRLRFDKLNKKDEKIVNHRRRVVKSRLKKGLFGKEKTFYYEKQCGRLNSINRSDAEDFVDAEVLLSQIYAKAGFNTALYLPTVDRDNIIGVVSNGIDTEQSNTMQKFGNLIMCNPYEYVRIKSEKDLQKYFKDKALRDYVKMHVFDVACGNTDRHHNNFFVDVKKTEDGLFVADGIILFDYSQSVFYLYNGCSGSCFCNGLGNGNTKTRSQMIEEFKNNELVNSCYNCTQLSEMLGNIDVFKTAEDIKQTINYEIDDDLVNKYAKLIDDTAEELVK